MLPVSHKFIRITALIAELSLTGLISGSTVFSKLLAAGIVKKKKNAARSQNLDRN